MGSTDNLQSYAGLEWEERYFLLWQQISLDFRSGNIDTSTDRIRKYDFYDDIYVDVVSELGKNSEELSEFSNKSNIVYVVITQFLTINHAPTAKALSVASYLKRRGFLPVIVNTAEYLGGENPGLKSFTTPNYIEEFSNIDNVKYGDDLFPIVQFPKNMPKVTFVKDFVDSVIESGAPFSVLVGDMSIFADVLNLFVPVLELTTTNQIGLSHVSMQAIGRSLNQEDMKLLEKMSMNEGDIAPGNYVYNLPENRKIYNREQFGIDNGPFLICIAGNRLETELSNEFMDMLNGILSSDLQALVLGEYRDQNNLTEKYDNIRRYCHFAGFQEDVFSAISVCDLFVNPPRQGGGTTAVMALAAGIPVVTLSDGDVANAAGESFCTDTLDEMKARIVLCSADRKLYKRLSEEAKARARMLTDENLAYDGLFESFLKKIN